MTTKTKLRESILDSLISAQLIPASWRLQASANVFVDRNDPGDWGHGLALAVIYTDGIIPSNETPELLEAWFAASHAIQEAGISGYFEAVNGGVTVLYPL